MRSFRYVYLLPALLVGLTFCSLTPALAQRNVSDPIARKAYNARYERLYVLAGAALPNYSKLNDQLGGLYPRLLQGALVGGAGYGIGYGPLGGQVEWRWGVRSRGYDSRPAYTQLVSSTISLLARYHIMVRPKTTLSAMAGFGMTSLALTLKDNSVAPTSVANAIGSRGDKHRLYQRQGIGSVALQFDRHWVWNRRLDVAACGRARQFTLGARFQYDIPLTTGAWRTERAFFRTSDKLTTNPALNPLGASLTLVAGGLFNRF